MLSLLCVNVSTISHAPPAFLILHFCSSRDDGSWLATHRCIWRASHRSCTWHLFLSAPGLFELLEPAQPFQSCVNLGEAI